MAGGTLVIRFMGDMKHLNAQTASLAARTTKLGGALTKGLTLPLVAVGVAAGKSFKDFNAEMSKIEGLVGLSKREVDGFSKAILKEGPKWGKSPQELAEALFFVTSAGFKGKAAMDVLRQSAMASAAGLGETKVVADLVTSAVNAYGIKNLKAAGATDILTNAVKLGKLEADQLASAMGMVLPVASNMGVTFDQVGAAMAAMSKTGTNASQASTQLRAIMTSLLKPTAGAEKTLTAMGTSSEELRKQMKEKGLLSVLETLQQKFKGNSAETAKVFGNVRALSGVMDLMGANVEDTRKIFGKMENSTGTLDAAFKATQETAQFKLDAAMGRVKSTLISIGSAIMPTVAQGFERLSAVLEKGQAAWNGLDDRAKKFILAAAGIAAAVGPVLLIIGKLLAVVAMVATPVGLVVAGIAALAAIFVLAKSKSEGFRGAIASVASAFTNGGFLSALQAVGKAVGTFVSAMLPVLQKFAGDLAKVVVPALQDLGDVLSKYVLPFIAKMLPVLTPVAKFIVSVIGSAVVGAIKGAIQFIEGLVNVIAGAFKLVKALVTGQWGDAWKAVKQIVGGVIDAVVGLLKVWFNVGILGIFKAGIKAIIGAWKGLWDDALKLVKTGWDNIGKGVSSGTAAVGNFIKTAVTNYISFWTNLFSKLVGGAKSGWTEITGWFTRSLSAVGNAVKAGVDKLVSMFTTGMTSVKNAIQNPWQNVIKPVFDKLADVVKTVVPGAFRSGVDAITKTWGAIKEAARKPVAFVVNTVWNEGLRRVINAIPGTSDLSPIRFAKGGVMPGYTPGRDVHQFYSPTAGRLALSGGEAFMVPEFTRAVGGSAGVERLNRLARKGQLPLHGGLDLGFFLGGTMPAPRATQITRHTSGYPWAKWSGDLNVPGSGDYGDPAVAWRSGVVASAAKLSSSYGWHYRVNHPSSGEQTLYAHLSGMRVNPGQVVGAGQLLGAIGSTGNSSGPHLHFELAGGSSAISGGNVAGSGTTSAPVLDVGFIETIKKLLSSVGGWLSKLTNMGAWGGLVKGAAVFAVDRVKDWIAGKIGDVLGVVGDVKDGVVSLLKDAGSGLAGFVGGLFDGGGMLRSGRLAMNLSGKPERVLDPRTTANFEVLSRALSTMGRGAIAGPVTPYGASVSGDADGGGVRDITIQVTAPTNSPRDVARATALALRMAL